MKKYLTNLQLFLDTKFKKTLFLLVGFILGYIYVSLVAGKHVGEQGLFPSARFALFNHQFFLHHWILSPIYALLVYLLFRKYKQYIWIIYFVMAFLLGEALQGFTYPDWYIVVK